MSLKSLQEDDAVLRRDLMKLKIALDKAVARKESVAETIANHKVEEKRLGRPVYASLII